MKNKLTVIDFFCGAGGFSEGFRQQGFEIVGGIDYWKPAIDTHNLNHGLNDTTKSVLDFWSEDSGDVSEIERLEDTACIVGSPPCVSFSSSNKSGKADKGHGIRLIEAYLRVVAVKKHKLDSKLLVWYMENVPNSQRYVKESYSFQDLNLEKWAKSIEKKGDDTALKVRNSGEVLNSGDYGAPQSRLRFICGEWCETGEFLGPTCTHTEHVSLGEIRDGLPPPNLSKSKVYESEYADPNYRNLVIRGSELTDHFYDTGLYIIEWEEAQYLKQNHSYMGRMSFPENRNKPCRTIMATRSAKTREALVYKSEYDREGNGEYRLPTIREIASLMGFPIVYQFTGSEGSKWRQVGNAVSPHLSSALAKAVRKKMGFGAMKPDFSVLKGLHEKVEVKLNTFEESRFDKPKRRNMNARFRRHPFKSGNMTVELLNYTSFHELPGECWYIEVFFGTGIDYRNFRIQKTTFSQIGKFLSDNVKTFDEYKSVLSGYEKTLGEIDKVFLQSLYETDLCLKNPMNPVLIVKEINKLIQERKEKDDFISTNDIIPKNQVPVGQLYAMYSLGKLFL